jgi:hypothetical protein
MTASDATFVDDKGTNCACCGKFVKKPVRWRGAMVGKNCADDLNHVRMSLRMCSDVESVKTRVLRDWPRSGARLLAMAAA